MCVCVCLCVCVCVCVQLLRERNIAEAEQLSEKYSSMSEQFEQKRQDYLKEHPDMANMGTEDWQYEVEMEQNVRQIADVQAQLSRDITWVSPCTVNLILTSSAFPVTSV